VKPRRSVQGGRQGELFAAPVRKAYERVAEVAVAAPIRHLLSYAVPDGMPAASGFRVRVPVGARATSGFLVSIRPGTADDGELKPLGAIDPRPMLTPATLALGLWMADHYGAAPGEAFQTIVPAPVRAGGGARTISVAALARPEAEVRALLPELRAKKTKEAQARALDEILDRGGSVPVRHLLGGGVSRSTLATLVKHGLVALRPEEAAADAFADIRPDPASPPELTVDQDAAVSRLLETFAEVSDGARGSATFLLRGVTGSGKTEVYLRAAEAALARGRGVIMLVPEIALTPQTVERLRARLGSVAVLHSNQSDSARAHQWEMLRTAKVRVALGPRSVLFAPIVDLGLIIIDEEHETTFKQQNAPRYHARDVAFRRAAIEHAVVVLGSATPSLEAEWLGISGAAERLELPRRIGNLPMPHVKIIDMRHEKPVGPGGLFSASLCELVRAALGRGEQALLLLNRRGFSTHVFCRRCGFEARCPDCAVHLTYYRGATMLLCHYCGRREQPPGRCPECTSPEVRYVGAGTEKVMAAASALFAGARIGRMDGETLKPRGAAEKIYRALRNHEIDLLVGTQVIAKGIDIPGITTIGVVSADTALLLPDFRAAERTFQLLCQVAGRAGRGSREGQVVIQTFEPDHYAIISAARHDQNGFARQELEYRRSSGYPPFGFLLRLVFQGPDSLRVETAARERAAALAKHAAIASGRATLLGPAPCPILKVRNDHRWHLLVKAREAETLSELVRDLPESHGAGGVRMLVDRDPVALL
jgi:primosomal protein N' (replication factor Y) (superfamily II helicase)